VKEYFFPTMTEAVGLVELPPPILTLIEPPVIQQDKVVETVKAQPIVRPHAPTIPTEVVRDELVKPEVVEPIKPAIGPVDDIEGSINGQITGNTKGGIIGSPLGSDSGTAEKVSPPAPVLTAEIMPQFIGGNEALMRYMQKNLRYPPQALRNGVEGRAFISFTVQADGSIADVQVLKGLGFGTDEEASRVVKNMPTWIPGQQNKRTVAVRYTIPITFEYK
jgi:protein TonB